MKREFNIFLNAILYYTRIPVPRSVICDNTTLAKAYRYFPLAGYIIGGIACCVFNLSINFLPVSVSVIFAMLSMILITGALHEDGLADFVDGFGAGYDKENILRIMKDSNIGTYGVISLIMCLLLKFFLLTSILGTSKWFDNLSLILLIAPGTSRVVPMMLISSLPYARIEKSKVPQASLGMSNINKVIILLTSIAPLFLFKLEFAIYYLVAAIVLIFLMRYYVKRKIEGYTGDIAGAAQTISEILFYVIFTATY